LRIGDAGACRTGLSAVLHRPRRQQVHTADRHQARKPETYALLEEGNPRAFAAGLGDVARAKGMSQIARDAGLSRESLYKALSGERNPELGTVMGATRALGLKLVPAGLHSGLTNHSSDTRD
jgi:probable addiction module antidote protein